MQQNFLLLLPCFASLFWAFTLLFEWKENLRVQNIWAIYMLATATNSYIWSDYFAGTVNNGSYLISIEVIFFILSLLLVLFFYKTSFIEDVIREKNILWLSGILLLFVIPVFLYVISSINVIHLKYLAFVIMAIWGGILYLLSYNIYHFTKTATDDENVIDETVENEDEITEQEYKFLIPQFEKLVETDLIFLKKNLHLEDVARMIHTNRTYISRLINEEYQSNFSDFINSKRIEYAQNLMHSHPHLTQEQIADKSGFIHSTSFSRTFKQQVGMTFREWRKKNNFNGLH